MKATAYKDAIEWARGSLFSISRKTEAGYHQTKLQTRADAGAAQADFDARADLATHKHAGNGAPDGRRFATQPEIAPHAEFMRDTPDNVHALMLLRHSEVATALVNA